MTFHRILFVVSTLAYQVSWSSVCTVDWENSSPAQLQTQPPCPFNALCMCSNPGPSLGLVQCIDTPLDSLPPRLNSSKVFILRLENNGLRVLDEGRFFDTGMWRLQIRHNLITRVPENTFHGLEHSLRELDLRNNRLHFFPREAVRSLVRLNELDLTGNFILSVTRSDFVGLERSLTTLVLRCNALTSLDQDTFSDLVHLVSLDLSENRLSFVAETSFHSGSSRLRHFNLADNALTVIPYGALSLMKSLRTADLSRNRISLVSMITDTKSGIDATVSAALLQMSGGLTLESLNLNENQIETLVAKSFRHFTSIKHLSLAGNPLTSVLDDAFLGTTIEELDMRACDLQNLSPEAFNGLRETLRHLDLAHNLLNASSIGMSIENMTSLVNVSFNGNIRSRFNLEALSASANSLQEIHLESADGKSLNLGFQVDDFMKLKDFTQLRTFGLSQFASTTLQDVILSPTVESIILKGSNLKTMDKDSFRHTPRLRNLDISSNQLIRLEKNVFKTVGRSMEKLMMANAFSLGVVSLSDDIFEHLENLKELDLSNNQLLNIPSSVFAPLTSLECLNLQDNALTSMFNSTFRSDLHSSLTHLKLSVNRIGRLQTHTFHELSNLRDLYLDDNAIQDMERSTMASLKHLEYLDLSGNLLMSLDKHVFQDLPNLRYLNLARNRLKTFHLDAFDQVGTLSSMRVDVSDNQLQLLAANYTDGGGGGGVVVVNIKVLDLRHNNISFVDNDYFEPIKDSLMELHLDHNSVTNLTSSMFGEMPHLRVLHLSHNQISTIDANSFEKSTSLQSVTVAHNLLTSLSAQLFAHHDAMRHLDVSDNRIRELPEGFLRGTPRLERLQLSRNRISHFPDMALASNLRHLDLSHNQLRYLPKDVLKNPLRQLDTLNLANNELKNIEDGTLAMTSQLRALDLSGNPLNSVGVVAWNDGQSASSSTSTKRPPQLERLNLSNASLTVVPNLNFPHVLSMNLSHNDIDAVTLTSFKNTGELRHLDLSYNRLKSVPVRVWSTIPRLASLSLAFNPMQSLMNESFLGLNVLDEINMQGFGPSVRTVQSGVFLPLKNLRTLHASPYSRTGFDLVHSMSVVDNLRHLHVQLDADEAEQKFALRTRSPTLTSISIRGIGFRGIVRGSLAQLRNRNLRLTVANTTINSVDLSGDGQLGAVRRLWLDVSYNDLVAIADPSTTGDPNGRGVFMQQLRMEGNRLQCNCDLGWIEHWMRRFRQKKCSRRHRDDGADDDPSVHRECQQTLVALRMANCYNLGNKTLVDVLEEDLECGISSTAGSTRSIEVHRSAVVTSFLMVVIVFATTVEMC